MYDNHPNVSVIIPTYNRSSLVRNAVRSVLNQTYSNYEIIIADDGSTDDTKAVLGMFVNENPNRIIYLQLSHRGRSSARNQAIQKARGKYIAFLDSDDVYFPNTLQVQVDNLDTHPNAGMVYGTVLIVDTQGNLIHTFKAGSSGWIYRHIAFFEPLTIVLSSVLVRRKVLDQVGGFDEDMDRFEDTDMWRRISRQFQILAINKPLCQNTLHDGNRLGDPIMEYQAVQYYVKKIISQDSDEGQFFLRRSAANLFIRYGLAVWDNTHGCKEVASRFAWRAFSYWPFDLRIYFLLIPKCFWKPLKWIYGAFNGIMRIIFRQSLQGIVQKNISFDTYQKLKRKYHRLLDIDRS